MRKNNIQILLSDEEYMQVQERADKVGLTVPLYIKSVILQGDDFATAYQSLIERVERLPSGIKFNIKALFGVEWTMSRGVKLNLGKTYYNRVKAGVITNVKIYGKDSSNVMWYEKL